jgi:phosphatidate cytidylyltransferase
MLNERVRTATFLLSLTLLAYYNHIFFVGFISTIFVISSSELLSYKRIFPLLLAFFQICCLNSVLYNYQRRKETMFIFIYNSISDIIQFFVGKYIGKRKVFNFTSKTLEGYVSGLILTHLLFYQVSDITYIQLNIIGMFGGIISSLIKRSLGVKHWSTLLGEHGGINDRLDSIIFPLLVYYNSYN